MHTYEHARARVCAQAITTGGLPTFVDVGDLSFQSSHLSEDNLIQQLVNLGKRVGMHTLFS
jgi:hypothetical protein